MGEPFREKHWLMPNHGERMPTQMAFLAIDWEEYLDNEDDKHYSYRFKKGYVTNVKYKKGSCGRRTMATLPSREAVWVYLYGLTRRSGPTNVIISNPRRDLVLVGISAEIAAGRASVSTAGQGKSAENSGAGKDGNRREGFLWIGPDRGIVILYHAECKIVLLGMGNFVDYDEPVKQTCEYRSGEMADIFARYLSFLKENHCGGFAMTVAAQSLRSFRHAHKYKRIFIHSNEHAYNLENKSLRGGREQLFFYGATSETLYHVDVNSMYGAAMRGRPYPSVITGHWVMPSPIDVAPLILAGAAIARVRLSTHGHSYPYYDRGNLMWAEGNFTATLAGPELKQAYESGEVVSIGGIATYEVADIFTRYVNYWWDARQRYLRQGDGWAAHLCKMFLQRLWGKFGQKSTKWVDNEACRPIEEIEYWRECVYGQDSYAAFRHLGRNAEKEIRGLAAYDSFPAIASYVTSYARLHMDGLRRAAGYRNVYLQYVDALIVNKDGLDNLQESGKISIDTLGACRVQSESQGATFYGPTDYVWQGVPKICGIPSTATPVGPDRYRFIVADTRTERGDYCSGAASGLREVVIELKRPRPHNFIRADDWLGPVVVNE